MTVEDPKYVADDIVSNLRTHIEDMLKERGIPAFGGLLAKMLSESDLSVRLAEYINTKFQHKGQVK